MGLAILLGSDPMLDTDHWWWEVLAIVAAKVVAIFVIGLVGTMFMVWFCLLYTSPSPRDS